MSEKKIKLGKQIRAMSTEGIEIDVEKREVKFSFSSELPVDRYFGKEILLHDEGCADLTRLNNGGALLWNHDADEQIGVVLKAWIEEKRGYCSVKFSRNEDAEEIFQDIQDGIIRNVSFGYFVNEYKALDDETFLGTKWMPFEVSMVSIPADPTVGIGRSVDGEEKEIPVIEADPVEPAQAEEKISESENSGEEKGEAVAVDEPVAIEVEPETVKPEAEVKSVQIEIKGQKMDNQKPLTGNEGLIGMNEKELKSYSVVRALHALANPNDKKAQELAGFEREISEEAVRVSGKPSQGIRIPLDVLKRDLVVGTASAGGNLVQTDLLAGSFIDLLRNKSAVLNAGATMLSGLVGNVAFPKQSASATGYWVAENGAPTESQQALAQVTMSPKTVGAYTDYSRRLLLQSSVDVENFVKSDLAKVIALAIDSASLYGTGASNQPSGIKTLLAGGSQEVNFAAATPTFAEIVSLESKITSANADVKGMKYIVNANMAGALKTAPKVTGYPVFILENGQMNGYETMVSNQIASGDVFFGNFADLLIGMWSGLDLMVDPYSGSTAGTVRIVALQDCDIAVRNTVSFARGNDVP